VRSTGKRIAVLFHENDRNRDLSEYVVWSMADIWREAGHDVVFVFGARRFVPADLVLVHIDLSVVPARYVRFARRYPIVVNGEVRDIRKRRVSEHLLRRDDDWDGPVIVKSDLNAGGQPERVLGRSWLTRRSRRVRRALLGRAHPLGGSGNYELHDGIADVPPERFADRRLVVEKFRPELEDGLYHTRVYQFLGPRETCARLAAEGPIVKNGTAVRADPIEPHAEIVAARRRFSMDYGKLDYVVSNGQVVLLDVNKTATSGPFPVQRRARSYRAEGLYSYFRD
jgi:hypothetical protein